MYNPKSNWYVVREFMEKHGNFFKPSSDMACVLIYNDHFKLWLNGNGSDGIQRVSILHDGGSSCGIAMPIMAMFEIKEEAYLSDSDCSESPIATIPKGKYYAFNYDGLVLIQPL